MEAPDFWDDAEVSQKKMKELKDMKDDMETYQNLVTQMEDMETMIEMGYEENDPALIPEIQEMLDEFQKDFDNIRIKTLLSGEYDSENAIIKLIPVRSAASCTVSTLPESRSFFASTTFSRTSGTARSLTTKYFFFSVTGFCISIYLSVL